MNVGIQRGLVSIKHPSEAGSIPFDKGDNMILFLPFHSAYLNFSTRYRMIISRFKIEDFLWIVIFRYALFHKFLKLIRINFSCIIIESVEWLELRSVSHRR